MGAAAAAAAAACGSDGGGVDILSVRRLGAQGEGADAGGVRPVVPPTLVWLVVALFSAWTSSRCRGGVLGSALSCWHARFLALTA